MWPEYHCSVFKLITTMNTLFFVWMLLHLTEVPGTEGYDRGRAENWQHRTQFQRFDHVSARFSGRFCPHGWLSYQGSCYYFSRDRLEWYRALVKCISLDGNLVSVDTAHENTFIRRQLMTFYIHRGAWMGLNNLLCPEKDAWYWGVTTSVCTRFDWFSHGPIHSIKKEENCGLFWQSFNYHWHIDSCNRKNYYICEKKKNPNKQCRCHY